MNNDDIDLFLEKILEDNRTLKSRNKKLLKINSKLISLIDVFTIIVSSLDINKVLKSILEQTKNLMKCNNSSILLVDESTDTLYFEYLSDESEKANLSNLRLKKGEGIAGTVWKTKQALLISDTREDKRFSSKADTQMNVKTKSLIAAPLLINNDVIGVMEAINKKDGTSFSEFDLELFKTLCHQAAISIYNAKLYQMATRDGLTKLYLKRYYYERLIEEFSRAKRYKNDLALLMLDIDHFKNVNDSYGHQFGDEVLIKVAYIIMDTCRASDIPARYGGEEFSVILTETGSSGAFTVAERIRSRLENLEFNYKNKKIKVTISSGVASLDSNNPKTADELIEMSDKALYYSKKNGRNQVNYFTKKLLT